MIYLKNLLKSIALLFALLMTIESYAIDFSVQAIDHNTIAVYVREISNGTLHLTIQDRQHVAISDLHLNHGESTSGIFNIDILLPGVYTLIAEYDNVIRVQTLVKNGDAIQIDPSKLVSVFHPTYRKGHNYIDLDMLVLGDFSIQFTIKNDEGTEFYNQTLTKNGTINKRFNYKRLKEGDYIFSIKVKGNNFTRLYEERITHIRNYGHGPAI